MLYKTFLQKHKMRKNKKHKIILNFILSIISKFNPTIIFPNQNKNHSQFIQNTFELTSIIQSKIFKNSKIIDQNQKIKLSIRNNKKTKEKFRKIYILNKKQKKTKMTQQKQAKYLNINNYIKDLNFISRFEYPMFVWYWYSGINIKNTKQSLILFRIQFRKVPEILRRNTKTQYLPNSFFKTITSIIESLKQNKFDFVLEIYQYVCGLFKDKEGIHQELWIFTDIFYPSEINSYFNEKRSEFEKHFTTVNLIEMMKKSIQLHDEKIYQSFDYRDILLTRKESSPFPYPVFSPMMFIKPYIIVGRNDFDQMEINTINSNQSEFVENLDDTTKHLQFISELLEKIWDGLTNTEEMKKCLEILYGEEYKMNSIFGNFGNNMLNRNNLNNIMNMNFLGDARSVQTYGNQQQMNVNQNINQLEDFNQIINGENDGNNGMEIEEEELDEISMYKKFINEVESTKQYGDSRFYRYLTETENKTLQLISNKKIKGTSLIGNGAFGIVMKGTMEDENGNFDVAIKETQHCYSDSLIREATILKHSNHPNIVKFHGYGKWNTSLSEILKNNKVFDISQNETLCKYFEKLEKEGRKEMTYIILEYCDGGNLLNFVDNYFKYNPENYNYQIKRKICFDIRNSQKYLYDQQFIHRDIKLENFLVTFENNQIVVKCCDFGQTRSKDRIMVTKCGTPLYVDNNRYEGKIYTEKSDLYSIGVCYYYIVTGKFPPRTTGNNLYYNFYTKQTHSQMIFDDPLNDYEYINMKNLISQLLMPESEHSITWNAYFDHDVWK